MSKLLNCVRLTQDFVEQRQQEHAVQMAEVRQELRDTRATLARTRHQLASQGVALEQMHVAMQAAVRHAIGEHAKAVEEQMEQQTATLRQEMQQLYGAKAEAEAEAAARVEARLSALEEGLVAHAQQAAGLREEVAAQREAVGQVKEEVAVQGRETAAVEQLQAALTAALARPAAPAPAPAPASPPAPAPPAARFPFLLPPAAGLPAGVAGAAMPHSTSPP